MTAKRSVKPARETDLAGPVRDYLSSQGYCVRSEVLGCDITAVKGEDLIIVELKRQLSLDLIIQATQRQRISSSVYVAVPRPDQTAWRRRQALYHVLKRLELGLLLVVFTGKTPRVEVAFHPLPFAPRKQPKRRRAVIREIVERSADHNEGGSHRRKLVTAYREKALRIAWMLQRLGPQRPKVLHAQGADPKARAILYDNVYGWFDRIGVGLYALNAQGLAAITTYQELIDTFEDSATS